MQTTRDEFGRFFRNRRTALGLSLSEFCRQNGFDKGNISRLERGLVKPPESPDVLQDYADALKLQADSEDRKSFMRHAAIARGKLPSAVSDERARDVEKMFRRLGRRLHDPWVKARNLDQWSQSREAQATLPTLVRRLIHASTERPVRIEMPGGEGVQRHGWDGVVEAPTGSLFVPEGVSGWEISVEQRPAAKAERAFRARNKGPLGLPASEATFVFATSRKFDGKQKWRDEKRELGIWKSVEVYDSSDLEAWLETAPSVDVWLAEELGLRPAGVTSIDDHWELLSRLCEPRLKPNVLLASREKMAKELRDFLLGMPGVMAIQCRSPIEAVDFVAAYLALAKADATHAEVAEAAMDEEDRLRVQSRTIVVRDRAQWDGLSQAGGSLNLVPIPSLPLADEDLNRAVIGGHRVVAAATQFSNHRLRCVELPRPSRYDLEKALCESGFDREKAAGASRAAGGSLSVLKRHISAIPGCQLPEWCKEVAPEFLPMLLLGSWDEANEVDRRILSRLSDRPYGELQNVANRLRLVEDAPLTRIESRWRLVSPEDAWSLIGERVTDGLLRSFETVAIEVLSQEDESFRLSSDERFKASIKGTAKPDASSPLRHGISETTAILGSGFGPVAEPSDVRRREAAAKRIVRTTLQGATWLRWVTLERLLPWLAEAAPDEFLGAVDTDLRNRRPELARVLADDEEEHPMLSGCKHAGLLWALEGLAWSPDLLSRVCAILARLAEVDSGRRCLNRPAGSLCEILLPLHPQTAAGVEKRIGVLRSLAKATPAVAWKVLLAMLPGAKTSAVLTHRPVWRDWVSGWQEGKVDADDLRQVDAAAELIVGLVGTDPTRWSEVLDKLQLVPESRHEVLTDRLRAFPVDQVASDERRKLAERLRKTIRLHRDCADARWALPARTVDALEQALPALLPEGLQEQHAWLFSQSVELEGFRGDFRGMETEIGCLREDATRQIVGQGGLNGVLDLADLVESPGQVGATLAQTQCVSDDQVLPGLLRTPNANHRLLAGGYARGRIARDGWGWVHGLALDGWNPHDAAAFLAQAGLVPQAWDFAETLGAEVLKEYWATVPARSGFHLDQQQLEIACRRLMQADRPESAILILFRVTFGEVTVPPLLVMDALTAYAERRDSDALTSPFGDDVFRTVRGLFEWLQKTVGFSDDDLTQRLGQLEWAYLDLLDGVGTYSATPETLIRCLSDYPKFFAELIDLLFRSTDEQDSETQPPEEQHKRASRVYGLLMRWDRVPGTQDDSTIDGQRLLEWLESARSLCRESGHLEIADSRIGEMLASWPKPENEGTMWPCEAICDAIEEADSADLDDGFQIGVLNSRGVTTRSLLDGGDLERREAAKYRRWGELCHIDWPRTAASLRSVAESYDFEAQRQDARAAERAQERH